MPKSYKMLKVYLVQVKFLYKCIKTFFFFFAVYSHLSDRKHKLNTDTSVLWQ